MSKPKVNQFFYLLRYALPHRRLVALQFLLMGTSVSFGLLKPWPMKVLVDSVVGSVPLRIWFWQSELSWTAILFLACIAYLILNSGDSLIAFGSTTVASLTSGRMIRDLRAQMLHTLQGLSLKFHDRHKVGDLVHRVAYNTAAVETAFQSGFMGAIKSSMTLISIFVVMFIMNRTLTLVALAVVPLLILAIRLYARKIQHVSRLHQDQEGSVSSRLQELLSSIRLVQAFGREPWEQERFGELSNRSVATRLRMTVMQGAFGFSIALTLAMGTAFLFWVGIGQVRRGQLTLGEFLVFNSYLAMLYSPLSVLSYTASSVQSALGGGSRLFEILQADNENDARADARPLALAKGSIAFENVHFTYEENRPVLESVSFKVAPGETVALIGETGSGKSTILSLLLRFYKPQNGRIRIDGHDIDEFTIRSLRQQMSLVPQDSLLFSESIRENIAYGRPSASNEEIEWAAKMAEASVFINQLPEGYETLVGERGIRLSVGQRQRIALARAFLRCSSQEAAPILLLDEPTSALDGQTEARLMANLERLLKGQTVLLVTHRLSTVRKADRIIVLDQGRIVETGRHSDLLALNGYYARLCLAQSEENNVSVAK